MPRYMIIRKADSKTEAGVLPPTGLLEAMGAYMEEMGKAGILRGGDGLARSSEGKRITIPRSGKPRVMDGPFTETKELVAGYALIEVGSLEEAIGWVKKWPAVDAMDGEVTIEVRRILEEADFGDAFTPEQRERERKMRGESERK